ncbi:MAG: zinc ribbon domain-containing protein [Dehalococcoidia bacterium]|nr:zinc ribbon domain-containing protein [Dehalococcoidia bacterium]
MPLYAYVCPACKSDFELFRSMSQSSKSAACPECEQPAKRVLSVFAAFTSSGSGESAPIAGAGGGCACAAGGACACARG